MGERLKNLLNELKYDKVMLLAENKQLKALRHVLSSMDDDINMIWRQLKMLNKKKRKKLRVARGK